MASSAWSMDAKCGNKPDEEAEPDAQIVAATSEEHTTFRRKRRGEHLRTATPTFDPEPLENRITAFESSTGMHHLRVPRCENWL
jgi:hypothetical protein